MEIEVGEIFHGLTPFDQRAIVPALFYLDGLFP
jgi:hypothetical protein